MTVACYDCASQRLADEAPPHHEEGQESATREEQQCPCRDPQAGAAGRGEHLRRGRRSVLILHAWHSVLILHRSTAAGRRAAGRRAAGRRAAGRRAAGRRAAGRRAAGRRDHDDLTALGQIEDVVDDVLDLGDVDITFLGDVLDVDVVTELVYLSLVDLVLHRSLDAGYVAARDLRHRRAGGVGGRVHGRVHARRLFAGRARASPGRGRGRAGRGPFALRTVVRSELVRWPEDYIFSVFFVLLVGFERSGVIVHQ